jgi:hypothetical protein
MLTVSTRGDRAAVTDTGEFFALVFSDEELLRAEFDAIVAAEWPGPPPAEPGTSIGVKPPAPTAGSRPFISGARVTKQPRRPGIGGWARQRSPPARQNSDEHSTRDR